MAAWQPERRSVEFYIGKKFATMSIANISQVVSPKRMFFSFDKRQHFFKTPFTEASCGHSRAWRNGNTFGHSLIRRTSVLAWLFRQTFWSQWWLLYLVVPIDWQVIATRKWWNHLDCCPKVLTSGCSQGNKGRKTTWLVLTDTVQWNLAVLSLLVPFASPFAGEMSRWISVGFWRYFKHW